jgi:hypothetical protein
MKKYKSMSCIFLALVMAAMAGCVTREAFQPPSPLFQSYAKNGASPDEVKRALLDCGYDNPYSGFQSYKKVSNEELAKAEICMSKKGYRYIFSKTQTRCDFESNADLSVCKEFRLSR